MNANFQWLAAPQSGAVGQYYAPTALPGAPLPPFTVRAMTAITCPAGYVVDPTGRCVPVAGPPAPTLTPTCATALPWLRYSTGTVNVQRWINQKLTGRGCTLIKVDGVLGPATCGAAGYLFNTGAITAQEGRIIGPCFGNCQSAYYDGGPCGISRLGPTIAVAAPTVTRASAPTSRTVPSTVYGAPSFQWLGQAAVSCANCGGTVCFWCWDSPDFRNCRQNCINRTPNDVAAYDACTCSECVNENMCGTGGVGTRAPGTPWRTYDAEVCDYQRKINAVLTTHGYAPVGVDCKLGPRTCGAAAKASLELLPEGDPAIPGIDSTCYEHQSEWIEPTRAGAAPPPDCRTQPSICNQSTQSCDQETGECFADCVKNPSACGPGSVCYTAQRSCGIDCRTVPGLCGDILTCDPNTGQCVPRAAVAAVATKKAGAGAGVFILGLAALSAIGFALFGRG